MQTCPSIGKLIRETPGRDHSTFRMSPLSFLSPLSSKKIANSNLSSPPFSVKNDTLLSTSRVNPEINSLDKNIAQNISEEKSNYVAFRPRNWNKWLDLVRKFYAKEPEPEVSASFLPTSLDNRPTISVSIYDLKVTAMFDSGATCSVIGKAGLWILDYFSLSPEKSASSFVFTADKSKHSISGQINLPIRVDNVCKILTVKIIPSLTDQLILASDFGHAFQIAVDYRAKTISSQLTNTSVSFSPPVSVPISQNKVATLSSDREKIRDDVINSFKAIDTKDRLGRTDKLELSIETEDAKPIRTRQYPLSPYVLELMNKEVDEMIALDVIEPSCSPWCSPVLLVNKKNNEKRFCFDGRQLNSVTKHDSYPLPRIDRILSMLGNAKYISSIDLRKAFWQIPLEQSSKEKTAFAVPGRGLYQFKVVPFGLRNSAQTQQRLMDAIFGPRFEPFIFVYLDDIIIISSTFEQHVELLNEVRDRLKAANLTINFDKCEFFRKSLKYLGFIVDEKGLRTDPEKITAMLDYPQPSTVTEVKRFIGLCSWYRRFINHFSTLTSPINDLIKKKAKKDKVNWTPEASEAFRKIKEALISSPILSSPDFSKPFVIQCDASNTGLGGILTQVIDGDERVIAFASRTLSRPERNYSVTERECLSVVFCIEKFRPYVEGVHFTVITDHYSLLWLNRLREPTGRLARWAVKLQQFSFDLEHRKGKLNVVPDFLSRMPPDEIVDIIFEPNPEIVDQWYLKLREQVLGEPEKFPQWKVLDNFLYKFAPTMSPVVTNQKEWKLLIPGEQRANILQQCHDEPTAGHLGFFKTFARVSESFYWPGMRKDIMNYVRKCSVCGAQKVLHNSPFGLMGSEKKVNFPWQILGVDIIGPFPRSSKGYKYLLVATDWFSKYSLLFPLRKAIASTIIRHLEESIFLVFGVPQFIVADNGTQFAGKEFKKFAKEYCVQKIWFNARYHPQVNFTERCNFTIGTTIRCYITEQKHWDKDVAKIQHALNTAKHEVTGFSPSFLNFGRHVPLGGNYYGNVPSTKDIEIQPGDRDQYAAEVTKLSDVFSIVRSRLHQAYLKNSQRYNLRRRDISYQIGDKVWKRNKILSDAAAGFSSKLSPKYLLCKIKRKLSRLVYGLENLNGSDAGNWHVKDLKPYFGSNSDVSVN